MQWTCNQVAKKLTAGTKFTNGDVHEGPNGKILELWDQIENNN
jgi:hypothetical protein